MRRTAFIMSVVVVIGLVAGLVLSATPGSVTAQGGEGTEEPEPYTWQGDVTAPDFPEGRDWINVTEPLTMADLRGKIVILDFWTYGCINCIHIIPDLHRLEAEFPNEVVVIGVHSAKFENEGQTENIRRITRRYEVIHPVINDVDFIMWQDYGVRAWPTVMVIDPFGKVVGQLSGEPLYSRIAPVIQTMVSEYGAAGVLNLDPIPQLQPEVVDDTPLLFPGKVLADPAGNRLFISDSNHNRIIVAALDTYEILDVIGAGSDGLVDGSFEEALFFRPQGLALDGNMLYIADTENHTIRAANLDDRTVTTIAGTGEQSLERDQSGPGTQIGLNSPWDLVFLDGKLYIAMAGPHQIWVYDLASGEIGVYAGSGREALTDGALMEAGMNQPSGIDTDGTVLYVADPEASAIRTVDLTPDGEITTIVGTGLFDFGDVDGVGDDVLLQHPLGVTVADDGYLYITDTYNNKIKRIDPASRESVTYAGTGEGSLADGAASDAQFYEPGGLDFANGMLYIADTNNNAIRVIDMAAQTVSTVEFPNPERLGTAPAETQSSVPFGTESVTLATQTVAAGEGTIQLNIVMPDGYKFNTLAPFTIAWPDNTTVQIPADQRDFRQVDPPMPLEFPVTFSEGQTDFTVNLTVYWCEAVNETLCFVDRPQIVIPVSVSSASDVHTLTLEHTLTPPSVADTLQ